MKAVFSVVAASMSPFVTASPEAREIAWLWWVFCGVCVVVFGVVMAWLAVVLLRGRGVRAANVANVMPIPPDAGAVGTVTRVVVSAVVATVVVLFGLLVADFSVGRALQPGETGGALTIKITGRQWWWQIEYLERDPSKGFVTANELHLPLGRPVQLLLQSADVIHSFWVPSLEGKKDLVPGHQTALWITPDRPGRFRGQCAEFCGYQHAHMGLIAVVETPEEFEKWQEAQRASAPPPQTDSQKRGQEVFLTRTCAMCHAVQGTRANSRVGPPLTHFASQQTLAAGSFPNTRGHLAGWIMNPQAMKPGVRMPANPLAPDELHALLDYLETLK